MKRRIIILLLLGTTASAQAPETFEELSTKAQQAYEANRTDEAAQLYAQAVKLKPDWPQGWWALGMINYEADHYPECRDALTRMVELDASAAAGWALLGLCEFRTQQYDASLQHLKKAHMLVPEGKGGGEVLDLTDYHLAMLLTRQGAFEVAQEILLRLARRVKNNPDMKFAAGLACLRMPLLPSEVPAARRDVVTMTGEAFWAMASQLPSEAEASLKTLVAKYPKVPNLHYFYGTYLAVHHPEQCASEFLKELRITPDSVPARVELVLRYILDGKNQMALKLAREAVALSPDSVGAQLALAKALRANGKEDMALPALLEAKRLDPISPQIRLYLANTYRSQHRREDMQREMAEYNRLKAEQANWP